MTPRPNYGKMPFLTRDFGEILVTTTVPSHSQGQLLGLGVQMSHFGSTLGALGQLWVTLGVPLRRLWRTLGRQIVGRGGSTAPLCTQSWQESDQSAANVPEGGFKEHLEAAPTCGLVFKP